MNMQDIEELKQDTWLAMVKFCSKGSCKRIVPAMRKSMIQPPIGPSFFKSARHLAADLLANKQTFSHCRSNTELDKLNIGRGLNPAQLIVA